MNNPTDDIPNFTKLNELLEKSDKDPENLGYIYEMMEIEGYEDWLNWMKSHCPEKLP